MSMPDPTPKQKVRFWAIAFAVVLVPIGVVAYKVSTETTSGTVRRFEDLSRVYAGAGAPGLFASYREESAIRRFPFAGDIGWKRMQIRPQVHLTGPVDLDRLDDFLAGPPIIDHGRSDDYITFILVEPRVNTFVEINLPTVTAKISSHPNADRR